MTPSRRSLGLVAVALGLGVLATVRPDLLQIWLALGLGLLGLLFVDAALLLLRRPLGVERQISGSLALGVSEEVCLRLNNLGRLPIRALVHDSVPVSFECADLPRRVRVPAGGFVELRYRIHPRRRGSYSFTHVDYLLGSHLGLWRRRLRPELGHEVKVFPNFRAVSRYALLATDNRTSQLGIRKRQRRGQGLEFHQLRAYRVGDALRQIDWRATSRMLKVISREYRDERDQQVVFLLDCGRRMHGDEETFTFLDHALDAVLLLSYVALRQGDAVGLITFGGSQRTLLPRKGVSTLNHFLQATYDLVTTTAASDVYGAVEQALGSLKKRSLIVLVSNLRDEEDAELVEVLRIAGRRHLVLLASLREPSLDKALEQVPTGFAQALQLTATRAYLRARLDAHQKLSQAGVLYLDVAPGALSQALVNRYLEVKAAGVL